MIQKHLFDNKFLGLDTQVRGKKLIYLDSGATTLKLKSVVDEVVKHYSSSTSNIHRGNHFLAIKATNEFEETRDLIHKFLNSKKREEIIFTKGTTEAINLVAASIKHKINEGDQIIISAMEHHSNMIPWQMIAKERGAKIVVIPINNRGEIILEEFEKLLSKKTKIVAITHISNTLGTINPIKKMIKLAHAQGAMTVIDGAQATAHKTVDVTDLDTDFYCFSAHKMYGPTGVGVLYGKEDILNSLPPYQGGGEMIKDVTYMESTYNELPYKFEAGTPNIAGVIAFKESIKFLNSLNLNDIEIYENDLLTKATNILQDINGLKIIGTAKEKGPVISFNIEGAHHDDVGTLLDQQGIAVRTGHHCTAPLMNYLKIPGTVRASLALYNDVSDIEELAKGIIKAKKML